MEVRKRGGFTEDELRRIIERVSSERYEGNVRLDTVTSDRQGRVERFKLRTERSGYGTHGDDSAPGARRSAPPAYAGGTSRRLTSACWHAHRDILRAIFRSFPRATIVTAMARYEGLQGFEDTYPDTAYRNVGSRMLPAYMPDLCDCSQWLRDNPVALYPGDPGYDESRSVTRRRAIQDEARATWGSVA
jgi:hypothetical protein